LLVARGWDVHAVASRQAPPDIPGVTWHRADLLDRDAAVTLVDRARATHLLHLAWYIAPGKWAAAPENFDWVSASLALVRAFRAAGGTRVVTAGSCLEYDWNYGYCSEARTPCAPHTIYGTCKHALQLLTTALTRDGAMSSAWGRIFFLYGPHEHPDRLVASVTRSLLAGEPARTSHGNQVRDYLYAGDVADAFTVLLESDVTGPINIASGRAIRLRDIVERIGELMGRPDLIRLGAIPAATTDVALVVADATRLQSALGWQPSVELDAGLRKTIDWWRAQARAGIAVGDRP
jgi:nucleoside-diphosphate-sugar epimerase